MLILSRKISERIILRVEKPLQAGEEIIIMPTKIRGDQVRLGIDAPKSVKVDREEVHDARRRQS